MQCKCTFAIATVFAASVEQQQVYLRSQVICALVARHKSLYTPKLVIMGFAMGFQYLRLRIPVMHLTPG